MNRFILTILALSFPVLLSGQMFPLSDHYIYDALNINPAFAGSHDALSATILYRNQWVGFDDAPKNQMLSLHAPIYNDKVGLGLFIESNSIGIFKETNIIANYAYRIELHNGKLALGLGFGATVYHSAWNKLVASDPGSDTQLPNNAASSVLPAFSLGAYYYTSKYFVGFSLPLFLGHDLNESTGKYRISARLSGYNYFLSGGYNLALGSNITLIPSLLLKYHAGNGVQADYTAQVNLHDKVWIGAGYRSRNTIIAILQYQLNYQIRMGYSCDFETGVLREYNNGSHEIVLNYTFRYKRLVKGPRQF